VFILLEVVLIFYLGINFASAFFFYVVRYDVEYLLGGDSNVVHRGLVFVGMLMFGFFIDIYLLLDNFKYAFCLLSSDKSDLSLCSGLKSTNNFSDIRFGGDGD
jgi:hypothetical protein